MRAGGRVQRSASSGNKPIHTNTFVGIDLCLSVMVSKEVISSRPGNRQSASGHPSGAQIGLHILWDYIQTKSLLRSGKSKHRVLCRECHAGRNLEHSDFKIKLLQKHTNKDDMTNQAAGLAALLPQQSVAVLERIGVAREPDGIRFCNVGRVIRGLTVTTTLVLQQFIRDVLESLGFV